MAESKRGVLLINLGTPAEPSAGAIRRYLREFLSDKRVVEIPRLIWLPILYLIILPFRAKRLVHEYKKIWTDKGSPLLAITQEQGQALQAELPDQNVNIAMCYGNPSIESALQQFQQDGVSELTILPMYPQYSATTTAASFDIVAQHYAKQRYIPSIQWITHYAQHPAYIEALAQSVRDYWAQQGQSQHLLMSFHGIPKRNTDLGDPYAQDCQATAAALANALQLDDTAWTQSYQSRLGKAEWLQPYTDKTLEKLAQDGVKKVDVICPGFPADCLETLEEIQVAGAEEFIAAGGQALKYIPALNSQTQHIQALKNIIMKS